MLIAHCLLHIQVLVVSYSHKPVIAQPANLVVLFVRIRSVKLNADCHLVVAHELLWKVLPVKLVYYSVCRSENKRKGSQTLQKKKEISRKAKALLLGV